MSESTLTLYMCGPSKCEHDYSIYEPLIEDGKKVGETAVCAKCHASAFNEDQWS